MTGIIAKAAIVFASGSWALSVTEIGAMRGRLRMDLIQMNMKMRDTTNSSYDDCLVRILRIEVLITL